MHHKTGAVIVLMILAILVSACGGGESDDPAGIVEQFFNRLEEQSEAEVKALLCPDYRQNVDFGLAEDQKAEMEFDLSYRLEGTPDEAADVALVRVYGKTEVTLESGGIEVHTRQRRDQEAAWEFRVVKIDGDWLVCEPLALGWLDVKAAVEALE